MVQGVKDQQTYDYDIVIVGTGVIGSALALHLSQLHYRVALLDLRNPSFEACNPERVIALSEGSSRYLKSLGIWDALIALGAGYIKDIVVYEPGQVEQVNMSHAEVQADALGYVFEIRHVLQVLHQALNQIPGQTSDQTLKGAVDILCPAQCLSYEQGEAGVQLQVQTADEVQTITAALLVGADGTYSGIRKLAAIKTAGWDHNRTGIVASIGCEHGHGNAAYECFKEDGPLALLPLADGRFSLVWSVAPKTAVELLSLSDTSFLQILASEAGDEVMGAVGGFTSIGQRSSFPLELRLAKSFAKGRVLLAGNAAHTIHPIAGQGMNLGLRDVAVLADILAQPWVREDLDKPLIGQTYAERRRLDTLAVTGFTEGVLEVFSSSWLPQRWLRGLGLKTMQSTPALKQLLLKQAAGVGQLKGLKL